MPNGPSRAIWKRVPCWAKTKVSLYGRGGKSAPGGMISGSARGGSGRDIRSWPIVSSLDECMGNAEQGWRSDQHVATMPPNPRENKDDRRMPLVSRPLQTCLPPEGRQVRALQVARIQSFASTASRNRRILPIVPSRLWSAP
jgi:hypothetical protein